MKKPLIIAGIILVLGGIAVAFLQSKPMTQKEKIAFYKQQQRVGDLQEGDEAPDFTLEAADGSKTVQLSSFEGEREVVLIFGSYT